MQVLEDHVGIGDMKLRANPKLSVAGCNGLKGPQETAYNKAKTAGNNFLFFAPMPEFGISKQLPGCSLWSKHDQLTFWTYLFLLAVRLSCCKVSGLAASMDGAAFHVGHAVGGVISSDGRYAM